MKIINSTLAITVALSVFSGSASASNGFMTLQEKADQIAALRAEANKAVADNQAAVDKFNHQRQSLTDADWKAINDASDHYRDVMQNTQARIDAIQSAGLAPTPTQQQTPPIPGRSVPPKLNQQVPSITGTSYRNYVTSLQVAALSLKTPANSSIKKSIADIPDATKIKGKLDGKDVTLTAKDLKTIDPTIQIDVPFNSAFMRPVTGSNHHDTNRSPSEHGTGNGADNAQASHSSGGFSTAGSHIGDGHSGGGFAY